MRLFSARAVLCLLVTGLLASGAWFAGCGGSENSVATQAPEQTQTAQTQTAQTQPYQLKLAVEFTDHAACAMVAEEKGWFTEAGLALTAVENYITGTDLAAALARGDIQAAYICLVPAINARANGGVDIKVVAGTHRYGYGLVVDPAKISSLTDLGKPGIAVSCTQPGTASDVLLHRLCEEQGLPTQQICDAAQRMNPPAQVLALQAGKVNASFLPEHWATLAEAGGYKLLASAKDIWPEMQGSVLVVTSDLLATRPDVVEKLVEVTKRANTWITEHPEEAAAILAQKLTVTGQLVLPDKAAESAAKLQVTPETIATSMTRLEYRSDIDPAQVEETISYMNRLGYLKKSISAAELLDLRF